MRFQDCLGRPCCKTKQKKELGLWLNDLKKKCLAINKGPRIKPLNPSTGREKKGKG